MKNTLFFLLLILFGLSHSQTVTIGTQVWMTKNLDVATFRNGDPIPEAKSNEEWQKAGENKQPAWCYYNNDPQNGTKYGKLYNWYAVNDPRGLAPVGYHIPSHAEWNKLNDLLDLDAAKKMKSTSGWSSYTDDEFKVISGNGTNSCGFSGLPGGTREHGGFLFNGSDGYFWSSTEDFTAYAMCLWLQSDCGNVSCNVSMNAHPMVDGLSVRCIKD